LCLHRYRIVIKTFAYTNHTILREALEKWPVRLFKKILPEIYKIIKKIDTQLIQELKKTSIKENKVNRMKIIDKNVIQMAWLIIYGAHTINGVAELHTKLLKKEVLTDWFSVYPDKFKNITNGITQRRWLAFSNPELSALITDLIGNNEWLINLDKLKALEKYKDNKEVLNMFLEVKQKKKNQLALYISENEGRNKS